MNKYWEMPFCKENGINLITKNVSPDLFLVTSIKVGIVLELFFLYFANFNEIECKLYDRITCKIYKSKMIIFIID